MMMVVVVVVELMVLVDTDKSGDNLSNRIGVLVVVVVRVVGVE